MFIFNSKLSSAKKLAMAEEVDRLHNKVVTVVDMANQYISEVRDFANSKHYDLSNLSEESQNILRKFLLTEDVYKELNGISETVSDILARANDSYESYGVLVSEPIVEERDDIYDSFSVDFERESEERVLDWRDECEQLSERLKENDCGNLNLCGGYSFKEAERLGGMPYHESFCDEELNYSYKIRGVVERLDEIVQKIHDAVSEAVNVNENNSSDQPGEE